MCDEPGFVESMSYEIFKQTLVKPGVLDQLVFKLFEDVAQDNDRQTRAKVSKVKLKQQFTSYMKLIDKRNFIILRDKTETFD